MHIFEEHSQPLSVDSIIKKLRDLRGKPHVPASGYDVTSIIRMQADAGRHLYFSGVNVEYVDQRLSTHAEEGAIAALVAMLGKRAALDEVWVMGGPRALNAPSDNPLADIPGRPCGNCRQRLTGFARAGTVVHAVSLNGQVTTTPIEALLPQSFSFKDFAPDRAPVSAQSVIADAQILQARITRTGPLSDADIQAWLADLQSWDYASGCGQAVILRLSQDRYVAGVRIEDAAFTGTNAVQSALAASCALYNAADVEAVWVSGSGSDCPAGAVMPLSLAALQCLAEFDAAGTGEIPVTVSSVDGLAVTRPARQWAAYATTHGRRWIKLADID